MERTARLWSCVSVSWEGSAGTSGSVREKWVRLRSCRRTLRHGKEPERSVAHAGEDLGMPNRCTWPCKPHEQHGTWRNVVSYPHCTCRAAPSCHDARAHSVAPSLPPFRPRPRQASPTSVLGLCLPDLLAFASLAASALRAALRSALLSCPFFCGQDSGSQVTPGT